MLPTQQEIHFSNYGDLYDLIIRKPSVTPVLHIYKKVS